MGWVRKTEMRPPVKPKGNLELVKIPNFLHLTPPAIKRHCEAIKSQWVGRGPVEREGWSEMIF
jgi:hypothetical protein